ncbi:unnamed protein product [Albugo candida]|uniref:Uncharacterized protein n=1 Tax=Albugo candida TaxID=65357 RepID=A0A024FVQ9_9STRA|nr:unnamed protein product [Albugo candida]|eukprot:CCI11215.1 unnamed protein product [Albugo candida]
MSGTEKEVEEDKTVSLKVITCYVQPRKATSQCEKCLALHSSSFGVRAYTVRTPLAAFRTIHVLSTDYSQNLIKRNCNEGICGTMESISATACENLDGMFPNDRRMFHEAVRLVKEYGKIANPTTNRINQGNLDIRGMISSESKFKLGLLLSLHEFKSGAKENTRADEKPSHKSQEILFLEEFLSNKRWSCAYLAPPQSKRALLLNCIADKVAGNKGFFLVTSPSMTKLIILFDSDVIKDNILRDCNINYRSHYKESRDKEHVACDDYRNQHKTNPIVYHELSMVENVIPEKKPCLFIPHKISSFKTCGDCMETFFHAVTGGEEKTIERNSYLWWTHNEQKTWKAVNHILNNCVVEKRCSSIRLLSEMICSEHEQYWGEMKESVMKNTDQMIPFNSLTSRLWPPTRYARGGFDNRAILMVTFKAIHAKMCVKCMILETEVFYFYAPVNDRFGYLWMTQSHTKILQMCIAKNKCINIWYQKAGKELTLRQGMRPWSDSELQLVFRMHQSRKEIS